RAHGGKILFDVERNWNVAKSLLNSPILGDQIQFILIHEPLKQKLLDYARDASEDPTLIQRANRLLRNPSEDVSPHNDHFHLRVKPPQSPSKSYVAKA